MIRRFLACFAAAGRHSGPVAGLLSGVLLGTACQPQEGAESVMPESTTLQRPEGLNLEDDPDPSTSLVLEQVGPSDSKLEFSQTEMDLGRVYQGQLRTAYFEFKVEGPDSVVVARLDTSCGCTEARLEVEGREWPLRRPLPPGTQGRIAAVFDSERYSNRKTAKVEVKGNAANLPLDLNFEALVRPVFVLRPNMVDFGRVNVRPYRDEDPQVVIRVTAPEDFQILDDWKLPAGFHLEVVGESQPLPEGRGVERQFRLSLDPLAPPKLYYGTAVAETSLERKLEIPLKAQVVGPVRIRPEQRLSFGTLRPGQRPTRKVVVEATLPGIEIPAPEAILSDCPALETEVLTLEEGRHYQVLVKVREDGAEGRQVGQLQLRFPESSGLPDKLLTVAVRFRRDP
ncbi:MAG: DUF1573 domain-containing protein [Planctomycetota bacterium]|nr:MAG: DUF1573 domain-containing protein [Planctomycetota bacterium]